MPTKKPPQPAPEKILASFTIKVANTGRTSVFFETGDQPTMEVTLSPEPETPSAANKAIGAAGKVGREAERQQGEEQQREKQHGEKQLEPSDDELKAEFSKLIRKVTFESKEEFEPDASDGLYRKSGGEKSHFVTEEYIHNSYPDEKTLDRVLTLSKRIGWLISGPHEIMVHGGKCRMYKIDLRAIKSDR